MNEVRGASAVLVRGLPWWFGALLVLALWLIARPYAGLRHDGILYLGQALLHLRPEVMGQDLFFAYGSQDRFTVFSHLLAWMYSAWDVPPVQVGVLAVCHLLLLVATWQLLDPLPPAQRWWGLCALAVVSHQYGGHGIFAFAERFVTARTLAEPLAMCTLWALLRGRWTMALTALLVTAMVHPLMAIGASAIAWCWLVAGDRRWLWALTLLLVPLALAAAGVSPLDQLLRRYDPAWWDKVQLASGHLLILTWHHTDYATIVLDLGVLALGARWLAPPLGRLCVAVAAASVLLLAASWLAGDIGRNALLTQLQLWRVLWIAHLLAVALLPALALAAWQRGAQGRVLAITAAAAGVAVWARWPAGWVFIAACGGLLLLLRRPDAVSPRLARALLVCAGVLLFGLSVAVGASNFDQLVSVNKNPTHLQWSLLAVTLPALSLPAAAGLAWHRTRGSVASLTATMLVLAAIVYGVVNWDRRPLMTHTIENGLHAAHPFRALIPAQAQVFWWKNAAAVWVLLGRASYWSVDQGAGLPFNRATGFESERRRAILSALDMQEQVCRMTAQLNGDPGEDLTGCMPTREVLERVCRAVKGPDFLIFDRRLEGAVAQWVVNPQDDKPLSWYLYDCLHLR